MKDQFKDYEHLIRLGLLVVVVVAAFFLVRGWLIPKGFGQWGHYRPGALEDNRAHALVFAGQNECTTCHEDIWKTKQGGKHAGVHCEACHGALASHAAEQNPPKPVKPDPLKLCPVCHTKDVAKPAGFPQIEQKEHNPGAACTDCHPAHKPELR